MFRKKKTYGWLQFWCVNHLRALLFACGAVVKTPVATAATLFILGVTLALPAGFFLVVVHMKQLATQWNPSPSLTMYVQVQTSQQAVQQLIKKINAQQGVAQTRFISAQDGLLQFQKKTGLQLTGHLPSNPLPAVVVITPRLDQQDPIDMSILANTLRHFPHVDSLEVNQMWIKRLHYILDLVKRLVVGLSVLLVLVVILVVGNTLRAHMQPHKRHIHVLKMLGASYAFIRRPLLYRGALYGGLGGALAYMILKFAGLWLQQPLAQLLYTYSYTMPAFIGPHFLGALLGLSSFLGWIGAWFTVNKALHSKDPSP